ncbi:hypothetical protein EES39_20725 [Streptomyces sp. ADI92-24]|nr:hypothetical protein EES39_20725 [Streptomyces sp. ADI92-24]
MQQRRLGRGHHAEALRTVLRALLVVVRLQLRQMRAREQRQPQPRRPPRRRPGAAAHQQQRVRPGERPGGDRDRTAAELERLPGPRQQQCLQQLVLDPAAPAPFDARPLVLLGPVADPRDRDQPARAQQVEHRDVLRQPQRVVQRPDHRGHRDRDPAGGAEDGTGEDEGGGQPGVGGPVVLLGLHGVDAVLVGVRGHVQGRAVACRERGGCGVWIDEVEPDDCEGHDTVPFAGRAGRGRTLADVASEV